MGARLVSVAIALCPALLACGSHPYEPPGGSAGQSAGVNDLGSGTPDSVTFTDIYAAPKTQFVDLAFNDADPGQLWVISYNDDHTHIGQDVGPGTGTWKNMHDPAAIHFMHKPSAIAWGSNGLWATCGDNDNSQNDPRLEPNYFMGPALFTSDLSIFATQNVKTTLGSHVDMLHNTSFCRGIAHMADNVFWAFNGELGSVEKYNFNKPHEPGGDDHSDGEIYRYVQGQLKGVDGVSSQLAYDPSDHFLYIADTGNKRIVRLDTNSGTLGGPLPRRNEVLAKSGVMDATQVELVVPPGTLEQPSGIKVHNTYIYVSDTATSTFFAFDKKGKELRRLATGLPPNSLAGFTFGSDGKIWFVDRQKGKVVRIDPITPPPAPH
jgi:hypothetical protein